MEETQLSDWELEENRSKVSKEINEIQGIESIPSDWENLIDEEVSDKEITEAEVRLMQELEKEMILDGLLENDDLLGYNMLAAGGSDDSKEETITEQAIPIVHRHTPIPASSQSPTSKRHRSPDGERRVRRSRQLDPNGPKAGKGPSKKNLPLGPKIAEPKRIPPKSPKVAAVVSRKMKAFQGKTSPKKKVPFASSGRTGPSRQESIRNNIPLKEEVRPSLLKNSNNRNPKTKEGEEESQISPEPPA